MASRGEHEILDIDGVEVSISSPRKLLFPAAGYTKLDVLVDAMRGRSSTWTRAHQPAARPRD